MSCEELERELAAYHFGVVSDEARGMLEDHLPSCPGCVAAFLALKRDIETAESASSPSPELRHRLRRAVAREIGAGEPEPTWSWWERPLAFAFAGASVLVVMVAVAFLGAQPGTMPHSLRDQAAEVGSPAHVPLSPP